LGLFTARSFAEAFGGGLEIRDRAGGGTVVALTLPVDDRGAP
jgi:signal transduction histidine kinase